MITSGVIFKIIKTPLSVTYHFSPDLSGVQVKSYHIASLKTGPIWNKVKTEYSAV